LHYDNCVLSLSGFAAPELAVEILQALNFFITNYMAVFTIDKSSAAGSLPDSIEYLVKG